MKKLLLIFFLMVSVANTFDIYTEGKWERYVDLKQITFLATGSEPFWDFKLLAGSRLYFSSTKELEQEVSLTFSSDYRTIMFSSKDKKVFGKIKRGENCLDNGYYTSEIVINGHYFYDGCTEVVLKVAK